MKIKSIQLKNIMHFRDALFEFSEHHQVYTISGKNGCGKTTLIRCLQIFQQLYFYDKLSDDKKEKLFNTIQQIRMYFTDKNLNDCHIIIDFIFDDFDGEIDLHILDNNWKFISNSKVLNKLDEYWNIINPKKLIIFLDISNAFSNIGVTFDTIELKSRDEKYNELILDTIFNPEDILKNMYRRVLLDHVHYRIDPSIDNTYLTVAKELCRLVLPNMEIREISGTRKPKEFVLYGRMNDLVPIYDIRNFSAGEKALFLSMLFILYVQSIGILIFDELETHFHEELLNNYFLLLADIVKQKTLNNLLLSKINSFSEPQINRINELYANHSIEQIMIFTHSKSLIYNNFHIGKNYYIENSGKELTSENTEQTLRTIGLSSIYHKTLLVEGKDDYSFFNAVLSKYNIKVQPVFSCQEVIDSYKKIQRLKDNLSTSIIVYLVDKDNKPDSYWASLAGIDPEYFEKSFIRLDKHEIENYFLDPLLFANYLGELENIFNKPLNMDTKKIKKLFFDISKKHKKSSIKKSIQFVTTQFINESIISDLCNLSKSDFLKDKYIQRIKDIFTAEKSAELITKLEQEYLKYEDDNWEKNWSDLVDGKSLLNEIMHVFSKEIGISYDTFRNGLVNHAIKNPQSYDSGKILQKILSKFSIK